MVRAQSVDGAIASLNGPYLTQAIARAIQNPTVGVQVLHYRAELIADKGNYSRYGQPDYLGADAGQDGTGVKYAEPITTRGIFCRAKYNPNQTKSGIRYDAEMDLYLPENPGDVFVLDDKYPKRQDKFVISGGVYYATRPALPCQMGETVAAYQVSLSRERYPVQNDAIPS